MQKIFIPYVIWTVIYSLVNAYLLRWHDLQLFLSTLAQNLIWGNAQYHLYFVIIIAQMYLLYPFLRRCLARNPRSLLATSLILTIVCQVLHYFNLLSLIFLPPQYAPLYLRAFPVWIFYFVFGMFAADRLKIRFQSEQGSLQASLLGLAWLGCLILMILDSKLTGIYVSIVRPSAIIYTLSSFYFFMAVTRIWNYRRDDWFGWLSIQSFLVYLMHPLVLTGLEITARRLGHTDLWAGKDGLVFFYMSVAMVTILATYLISLTPAAVLLGGVRKKK